MLFKANKSKEVIEAARAALPSAAALERGRVALAAAIETRPARPPELQDVPVSRPRLLPTLFFRRSYAGAFSVLGALFMTGSVAMAQGAMPGQSLYPIKIASEVAVKAVVPGSETKAALALKFAERRLDEADFLIAAADDADVSDERKIAALEHYTEVITEAAERVGDAGQVAAERQAESRLTAHQETLAALESEADEESKPGVRRALRQALLIEEVILKRRGGELQVPRPLADRKMRMAEERIRHAADELALDEDDGEDSDAETDDIPEDDIALFEADVKLAEADALLDMGDVDQAYASAYEALRFATEQDRFEKRSED